MARAQSRKVAQWLLDQQLNAGDSVAVFSGPSIFHAVVALGCQRAGIPVAPITPAYSLSASGHRKLGVCVAQARARIAFVDDAERFSGALSALVPLGLHVVSLRGAVAGMNATSFSDVLRTVPGSAVDRAMAALGPATIAKIMHTSGSTGTPKAVPHTQVSQTVTVAQSKAMGLLEFGDDPPHFLEAMPFHHIMAGTFNLNNAISVGGAIYLDEGKPTRELFAITIANLADMRPHSHVTVPMGYAMLCDAMDKDPQLRSRFFENLKWMAFGGAAMSSALFQRLRSHSLAATGRYVPIYSFYGATEYMNCMVRHWEDENPNSIGFPAPGAELKLVLENDRYAVRIKSPTLMPRSGYVGAPEISAALFDEDGFFSTGDAVRFVTPGDPSAGFLFDGRLAEDFKLANGTWVSVGALRSDLLFALSAWVAEVVVTGVNQQHLGVLLWLRPDVSGTMENNRVHELIRDGIREFNASNTNSSRRIAAALIEALPLAPDSGEITDKGTPNQRLVRDRRAQSVARLFDETAEAVMRF